MQHLAFLNGVTGDSKAKTVDVSNAVDLTRIPSVSPPYGFSFRAGKTDYEFYANNAAECTDWLRALAGQGAKAAAALAETELDLSSQQLEKFPKTHFPKQHLANINLADNHLTKLPEEFCSYVKLQTLDLSTNQLKVLPDAFSLLIALHTLNISENQLVSLPATMDKMSALSSLTLSSNKFGEVPEVLFGMTQLVTLNYSYNSIGSGSISDKLGQLVQLRNLDLSGCRLASLPDTIGNLTSLRVLELFKNNLSSLPASIGNLKVLTQLRLGRNRLTALPTSLPTSLAELELGQNLGLNDLPNVLGALPGVFIDFVECPLTAIPAEHRSSQAALKTYLASRK